jgi:RHS repeat-associated protein
VTTLAYAPGGLLVSLKEPRGDEHRFEYDAFGRLTKDVDPSGSYQALARDVTAGGAKVRHVRRSGVTTTFEARDGERSIIDASGIRSTATSTPAGQTIKTPTATLRVTTGADPRFGMQAPFAAQVELMTGAHTQRATHARSVVLSDPTDPTSATSSVATTTVNGRASSVTWDAAARTLTRRSPAGRGFVDTLDARGRVVRRQVPGLTDTTYTYDARGRMTGVTQGTRTLALSYDALGRVASAVDPLGRALRLGYDAADRPTKITAPGGQAAAFGFDGNGNVTAITPPGSGAHAFAFGQGNQLSSYAPPAVAGALGAASYAYDVDGRPLSVIGTDGKTVSLSYDAKTGRLTRAVATGADVLLTYDALGRVASTSRGSEHLAFAYDGSLLAGATWSGVVAGSISYTYDDNLWLRSESVKGTSVAYAYDDDGLLTQAGALTLARSPQTGVVTATRALGSSDAWSYDAYGAPASYTAGVGGATLYSFAVTRDPLGRVTSANETEQGIAHAYAYEYDLRGRLRAATRDGARTEYRYDANGNRTLVSGAVGATATYDAQDRLLSFGGATYAHDGAGRRVRKTVGAAVTTYGYDGFGHLTDVALPDGRAIGYVLDAAGRRVGKRVDGALIAGDVYSASTWLVAELDGAGQMVSRFVYGARPHVPDLILRGGAVYRIVSDERGSVRLVVDAQTGAIAQELDYDAWGNVLTDTNPGFQPFGFAGGLYDADTRLVHFGAREYDGETGRWTTKDPSGFGGGLNFYAYADGDPVNRVDPTGHVAILIPIAIGAIEGAAIGATMDIAMQAVTKGCVDWGDVGRAAATGAVFGAVTGGVGALGRAGAAGAEAAAAAEGVVASDAINGPRRNSCGQRPSPRSRRRANSQKPRSKDRDRSSRLESWGIQRFLRASASFQPRHSTVHLDRSRSTSTETRPRASRSTGWTSK